MKEVLAACRRTWRRLGVKRDDARAMAAELEADLTAAEMDGTSVGTYVGRDLRGFALEWASARGLVRTRLALGSTALVSVLGVIPGAVFALFAAYGMSSQAFAELIGQPRSIEESATWLIWDPPAWLLLGLYALGAVIAYLGAIAAVSAWLSWRLDQARSRTLRYLLLGLPLGTVAAIFSAIAFAWTRDFSTDISVVGADATVAVTTFAFCVAALRLAAVRRERIALVLAGGVSE
jgi:Na+-transporting NADH:ubiquinone oxidoreductase subunit NqrE